MKKYLGISALGIKLAECKSKEELNSAEFACHLQKHRGIEVKEDSDLVLHRFTPTSSVATKAPPKKAALQKLVEARGMPWDDAFMGRTQTWWASDERVDSEGDIIRQSWTFDEFAKNSPMPFGHRWSEPPIGRFVDWEILQRDEKDYTGPALHLLGIFATKETSEWADTIMRLVKSGMLPGVSVGFQAGKVINVVDEAERSELGLGPWGLVFENNTLLETSPVTIPANPGAVTSDMMKSIHAEDIAMLREIKRRSCSDEEDFDNWQKSIIGVAKAVWPKADFKDYGLEDNILEHEEPHVKTKDITVVPKDGDDNTELLRENNSLLRELVTSFNTLSGIVAASHADIQTALDARAQDDEDEEDEDEMEDEKKKPEDDEDEEKSLENLVGSLSSAIKHTENLLG
jgi:hypothetical protein